MNGVYLLLAVLITLVSFTLVWRIMIYTYVVHFQTIFDTLGNWNNTPSDWNSTAWGVKSQLEPYMYNLPYIILFVAFVIALAVIFSRQTEGREYVVGAYEAYP